jgi:predicted nucleotidyltransferase
MNKMIGKVLKDPQKKILADKIADCIDEKGKEVIAVYLFGSFVDSESFSDIDIGILTSIDVNRPFEYETDLENPLEDLTGYPADVRVLNQAPISFSQNAVRKGVVILDKDPNLRADFESSVIRKYFDFSRFRTEYLSEVSDAPL